MTQPENDNSLADAKHKNRHRRSGQRPKSAAMTAQTAEFVRLDAERATPPGPRQVALVPGHLVPILTLGLPDKLRGAAREQVARHQLQDMLGAEPGSIEMRPFHMPGQDSAWRRVLVADTARVATWRADAGPSCRAVLPDYLGLPAAADMWVISVSPETMMARLGPGDGFSAARTAGLALLERALSETDQQVVPRVLFCPGGAEADLADLIELAARHNIPLITEAEGLAALGLEAPKTLAHGELAFDLRRDPLAARAELARRVLLWRWPVLIGLVAAGLWVAAEALTIRQLQDHTRIVQRDIQALTRDYFVPSGPILNVRAQIMRALSDAKSASQTPPARASVLEIMARAAAVIAPLGAEALDITHTPGAGLRMTLRVEDFAAVDRLAEALRQAGLEAEVLQSRVSGDTPGVQTELAFPGADS